MVLLMSGHLNPRLVIGGPVRMCWAARNRFLDWKQLGEQIFVFFT